MEKFSAHVRGSKGRREVNAIEGREAKGEGMEDEREEKGEEDVGSPPSPPPPPPPLTSTHARTQESEGESE